jgi:hypothetical protein
VDSEDAPLKTLPERPMLVRTSKAAKPLRAANPPGASYPRRRQLLGAGRGVRLGVGDSAQPPLRSGFTPSPPQTGETKSQTYLTKRGHSLLSYKGDISIKF